MKNETIEVDRVRNSIKESKFNLKELKLKPKKMSNENPKPKPSKLFTRRAVSNYERANFSEFGKDLSITDMDKDLAGLGPVIINSEHSDK